MYHRKIERVKYPAAVLAARGRLLRFHPLSRELTVRRYEVYTDKLSSPLELVLVTDLHGLSYGKDQALLLETIKGCRPDLILFAGDIVEAGVSFKGVKTLFTRVAELCPCFYVTGNHEFQTQKVPALKRWLRARGITVLDGGTETITVKGQRIQIGGVDDPHRFTHSPHAIRLCEGWKQQLAACQAGLDPSLYSILLTHRPELVRYYRSSGFDLVTAGHAHGGQVRIPGLCNGLFAPHQGFLPRYAGGCYHLDPATLIVSRGLCLNQHPRIFNPPELVSVRLTQTP